MLRKFLFPLLTLAMVQCSPANATGIHVDGKLIRALNIDEIYFITEDSGLECKIVPVDDGDAGGTPPEDACDHYDFYDSNRDGVIDSGQCRGITYDPCDPDGAAEANTRCHESAINNPAPSPGRPDPIPVDEWSVEVMPELNWASPGSQKQINMEIGVIKAEPFVATADPSEGGQISVASTTGNSYVRRNVWVSTAPDGIAMSARCFAEGTSSTVVRWAQRPLDGYCYLEPGERYYINYKNVDCDDARGCDINRIVYK